MQVSHGCPPVVDGETVRDFEDSLTSGANRGAPLVMGTTYNEFAIPMGQDDVVGIEVALSRMGASTDSVHQFRTAIDQLGPGYARSQLMARAMFRLPAVHIATEHSTTGSADCTWLYDFRYRSPAINAAAHCLELPFVWDLLDAPCVESALGLSSPQDLTDAMHRDWVQFITDGTCGWAAVSDHPAEGQVYDSTPRYDPHAYQLERELGRLNRATIEPV
jgi:para-nitrobenzyl esterase